MDIVKPAAGHVDMAVHFVEQFDGEIPGATDQAAAIHNNAYYQWLIVTDWHSNIMHTPIPCSYFFILDDKKLNIIGIACVRSAFRGNQLKTLGNITLSLAPSYRGKGIGTEVCNAFIERYRDLGYPHFYLSCDEDNIAAQKVIEKCGGKYLSSFLLAPTIKCYEVTL